MKLRTRLDVFSAALLSALGASQIVACGGTALSSDDNGGAGGSSGAPTSGIAGTAGNSGSTNHFPCKNPVDSGTGIIRCDEGLYHRATAVTCTSAVPRPDPYPDSQQLGTCKSDADCVQHSYGWCDAEPGGSDCRYGCITDSDCPVNDLCECSDPVGRCVRADCKTDADCAPGFLCEGYSAEAECREETFTCQSAADTCGGGQDCATGNAEMPTFCSFDVTAGRFQCTAPLNCSD